MIQRAWLRWSLALAAAIYLALGARHHRGELDPCLGGAAARVKFFSAFFPRISSAVGAKSPKA